MITIDNKPHKRTEHFRGTITLALSDEAQPTYVFELLRHTNGRHRYSSTSTTTCSVVSYTTCHFAVVEVEQKQPGSAR